MRVILNKKGQLKIQQMAFMLVALTIFFVLVLLLFLAVKTNQLRDDVQQLNKEQAIGLVSKLASTPEFRFEGIPNAIDLDKAMALRNSRVYKNFWGVKSIVIKKIYPRGNDVVCEYGNYPNCNIIKIFTDKENAPISSYVSLCRKENKDGVNYDKCEIGLLMIEPDKEILEEMG
jgi:hypothetical protein